MTPEERMQRARILDVALEDVKIIEIKLDQFDNFKLELFDEDGYHVGRLTGVKIKLISRAAYEDIGHIVPTELRKGRWLEVKQQSFMEVIHGLYEEVDKLKKQGSA